MLKILVALVILTLPTVACAQAVTGGLMGAGGGSGGGGGSTQGKLDFSSSSNSVYVAVLCGI